MRQIKFRAKRFDNKEWVYGMLATLEETTIIIEKPGVFNDGSASPFFTNWQFVDKETIGQFTGLLDKNGKGVYEGDIVKAPLLDPIFGDILSDMFDNALIVFSNGSFVVSYYNGNHKIYIQDLYDKIEVIGNIYDNLF